MTGVPIPPLSLIPGDLIHLAPHIVDGREICHREMDVQVAAVPEDTGDPFVVVNWRACPRFPGARPSLTGATVFHVSQKVTFLGRAA